MPFAILRFAKKKAGGVTAACAHNERKKAAYKSNPDIDIARSNDNYHILAPEQTYRQEINSLITAAGCKTRKDSTLMVETLITASPEFMSALPLYEQQEFFNLAFEFISKNIEKSNIISAVVHMDEKTPHMHLSFCPITADKKLSAKAILGNAAQLSKWQIEFHTHMCARWPELERGISSIESKRKHIPLWLFKQTESLDNRFAEVQAALADIGLFNAGKKRDKALSILAEWFPAAQRFTAQIKTVDEHICGLKRSVEIQGENADFWKDKANDGEKRVFKANNEIARLRRQLEQQQRLLTRIPPEILEELKTKERGVDRWGNR